jgi:hypothetical protein
MKLRSELSVKRELARVQKAMKTRNLDPRARDELYGAQQALAWALADNAMLPAKAGLLTHRALTKPEK